MSLIRSIADYVRKRSFKINLFTGRVIDEMIAVDIFNTVRHGR